MEIAQRLLMVWAWVAVLALVFFLWRGAFFYERASGKRLHHYLLVGPGALLAAGAGWYTLRAGDLVGEPIGDSLLFLGGLTLVLFGARLYGAMTGDHR
jgi:hypothetical protein